MSARAPGEDIRTFDDNREGSPPNFLISGTSFAAPMVAAAVAMYRAQNPSKSASECVDAVLFTRRFVPRLAPHCKADGVIDVYALLNLP